MKTLLWLIVICPTLAWGQMHELLRPTTDVDGGSSISLALDSSHCPVGTPYGFSAVQPNWYDTGGISTSSTLDLQNFSRSANKCSARVFKTWATTANTYTALTLNVNTSGVQGPNNGQGTISYSIDGGVTWTQIRQSGTVNGWAQTTDTVTLASNQDLTKLQVAANNFAFVNGGAALQGEFTITGFDIWTDGIYTPTAPAATPPPAPPATAISPIVISKLRKRT